MLTNKISCFKGIGREIIGEISIIGFLNLIKSSESFKAKIEEYRSETDKQKREELKKKLPAVTFSGTFKQHRNDTNLKTYSNYIVIDIDITDVGIVKRVKELMVQDPHIVTFFTSPSGGIKALVYGELHHREQSTIMYPFIIWYFQKYYNIELDSTSRNVSRLCFCSYDPDIYIAKKYAILKPSVAYLEHSRREEQKAINKRNKAINDAPVAFDVSYIFEVAEGWVKRKLTYRVGARNEYVFRLSCILNEAGVPFDTALNLTLNRFSVKRERFNEVKATVNSAYSGPSRQGKFGSSPIYDMRKKEGNNQSKII